MTLPIANQNWLTATPTGSTPTILTTASYPAITAWSGTVTYQAGAIVTGPDTLQYQALVQNTNIAPPAPATWTRTAYTSPDKGMLAQSAVALPYLPEWDPATAYTPGTQVVYGNNTFLTIDGSRGVTPPVVPNSNSDWEWVGSSQAGMLASCYVAGGSYSATVYTGTSYFDSDGALIAAPSGMSSTGATVTMPLFASLTDDMTELYFTNGNTLGYLWLANPLGFWQISDGMLYGSLTYSGAQVMKLLTVQDLRSDCCIGVTAQTEVAAGTEVGIIFRLDIDTQNYWTVSRSQIQKVVLGVATTMAAYTRLPVGSRFYVQLSGPAIHLYAYPGNAAAPVLIASVSDSFNQGSVNHGLYQQVI